MLNTLAGGAGLALQAALFASIYLLASPRRGRSVALLYAAMVAVNGYGLVLLGAMLLGLPWQSANLLLAAAGAVALVALAPRLRRPWSAALPLLRRHWGAIAIATAILLVHVVAATLAPELSIDGQLYHGPALAQLVQQGTIWGWETPNQYIYYTDLTMVGGINLATFTGPAVFDNGLQIPHLVILMLAINAALRLRFAASWVRLALTALLICAPVVWIQPRILYVDVAYAAAIVALVVMIAAIPHTRTLDLVVAATAAAAIVAIKPTGLLTGALLILAFFVVTVRRARAAGIRPGAAIGRLLLVFAPAGVLAAGFYLRNFVVFGNPVYPVRTKFGPVELPGIIDLSVFASGERGSGLVDPFRWFSYAANIADGAVRGVLKVDYDPRSGGFGHMPLVVLILAAALIVAQTVLARRRPPAAAEATRPSTWRPQAWMAGAALVILLVQPATFDSRYVIGPTLLLGMALLVTSVTPARARIVEVVAASLALAFVVGQVVWTERAVFPGLSDIRALRSLPEVYQPITPGGVWGRGEAIAWLPDDECYDIALQTSGGVSAEGMRESTVLSTLPYALYGPSLCNDVQPMQIENYGRNGFRMDDPIPVADFLLLYSEDMERWRLLAPDAAECWSRVQEVPGTDAFPTDVVVLRNDCR